MADADHAEARLRPLLRPRSIAVIGATPSEGYLPGMLVPLLRSGGFPGEIYPVNPRYQSVSDLRCYESIGQIGRPVDHAIIIVAQHRVAGIVQACLEHGVPAGSILSSGYAESGAAGQRSQQELSALSGRFTFLGPNCMGFANLADHTVALGSPRLAQRPEPGDVALISQSGGLAGASIVVTAEEMGLWFSYVVTAGNTAGVSIGDLAEYMFDDPQTSALLLVLEAETAVAEVVGVVARRGLVKPIVLLKLGRGQAGAEMAKSHTGALAGDYRLIRDVAESTGIVCADDIESALNAIQLLRSGIGGRHGDGIAAYSISGGNVTLCADAIEESTLALTSLHRETVTRLREILPPFVTVRNPLDAPVYHDIEGQRAMAAAMAADPGASCLVCVLPAVAADPRADIIAFAGVPVNAGTRKVLVHNGGTWGENAFDLLSNAGFPVIRGIRNFVGALELLRRAATTAGRHHPAGSGTQWTPPPADRAVEGSLTEADSLAFLAANGVPVADWVLARADNAAEAARELGYPVVVKSNSAQTHISDLGGVILDVRTAEEAAIAASRVAAGPDDQVIVARLLRGLELFASAFQHPQFGLVLALGTGGRLVEHFGDTRYLRLPASLPQIRIALASTLAGRALRQQTRGLTGFEHAAQFLDRLARLAAASATAVRQIEINPAIVGPAGCAAVDAAVVLA